LFKDIHKETMKGLGTPEGPFMPHHEAPEVYKRLPEALAAHAGSIRVKHTLRPLGVAMAGRDVRDPYKD
jgi:hypothetical protein